MGHLLTAGFVLLYAAVAQAGIDRDFTTPAEAAREIGAVANRFQKRGDPRGLFAGIYALTINASDRALKRDQFRNPEWVKQLVVNYANIYRRTLNLELNGQRAKLPVSWQLVFWQEDRRETWTPEIDVVYGINVHIARDLVEALQVTPTNFSSASVRRDYFYITETLRSTMPQIWSVYDSYARTLPGFQWIGQNVMMDWIARLRSRAWDDAYRARGYSEADKRALLRGIDRAEWKRVQELGLWMPLN